MSHDITAVKRLKDSSCVEIAYISISAGNTSLQTFIYESLGAQQYNNLSSGCGEDAEFSRSDIEKARQKLDYIFSEGSAAFVKEGRNSFYDLLQTLTGADVLDNGTILNRPVNLINADTDDERHKYERAKTFFDEILADGAETIRIEFH